MISAKLADSILLLGRIRGGIKVRKGIHRSESQQKISITFKLSSGEEFMALIFFFKVWKGFKEPYKKQCNVLKLTIARSLLGNRIERIFQNQERERYGRGLSTGSSLQKYTTDLRGNLAGRFQRNNHSDLIFILQTTTSFPTCQMLSKAREQAHM